MMKKVLALLLCVLLISACAIAETAETAETEEAPALAYEVNVVIPEGYTSDGLSVLTPYLCAQLFVPEDASRPQLAVVISYNESFADVTFNDDMDEEEFKACVDRITVDEETGAAADYAVQKTGLGTKIIVTSLTDGAKEYYSIWHGYEISLYAFNGTSEEPQPITAEQDEMIMQFLTDLDLTTVISELD